jgi:hypothetical protein
MQILPTVLAAAKESYNTFFVHLVTLYLRGTTLRFAVCDQYITFGGYEYIAFPVKIGAIKNTTDSKRDNVSVTVSDVTNAFKIALLSGSDFRGCILEIAKISYPESLSDPTAYNIEFYGEIDSPKVDDGKSEFTCVVKDPMSNYQCGRTLMLSCSAVFADADTCGATKNTATGTVQAGSTQTVIALEGNYADDHWKYGIITIGGQSVAVKESTATTIVTEYPFYSMPTGIYTLESGCSKNKAWCKSRYNNVASYGGFPAIPWELVVKS